MAPRPEDLDFARYRATGDPDALARVFDATAPRLLLLALHLAGRGTEAEDLVQATFLSAMESAGRYDPDRPVLPWLAGILANQARMEGRRAARTPDPERLPAPTAVDPASEAGAREVTQEILQALETLPEPYRPVLILRLLHGLRAVQVAHALGRSPETVRTQARRGLALLRAALPRGLAVGALAGILEGRGLAAVRVVVLAGAGSSVGVGIGGGLLVEGAMLMKKLILGLIALGGLALLVFLGPWQMTPVPPASGPDPGRPAPLAAASKPGEENPVERFSRTPLPEATAAALGTLLMGRCVAAEDGRPLGGCALTVRAKRYSLKEMRIYEADPKEWTPPPPAITPPDGRFAFSIEVPAGHEATLRIEAPGRIPLESNNLGGGTNAFGDVALVRGTRVAGTVVDLAGRPLAGVGLGTSVTAVNEGHFRNPNLVQAATSAEDGCFRFADLWPPGRFILNAIDGYDLVEGGVALVEEGAAETWLRLVVRRPDPEAVLEGVVVDDRGFPVAGAMVRANGLKGQAAREVKTAADGSFLLRSTRPDDLTVWLSCTPEDAFRPYFFTEKRYPWGARAIRLVVPSLRRVAGFPLEVVAARSGRPVTEFKVLLASDQCAEGRIGLVREFSLGPQSDGRVSIPHLEPTPHLLVVAPRTEELAANTPIRIDPTAQQGVPLKVRLDPPTSLALKVQFPDSSPVAGTRVEVLQPLGALRPSKGTPTQPLRPYESGTVGDTTSGAGFLSWGETATDAAGEVRFSVTSGALLAVLVHGPGHTFKLVEGVTAVPGAGPVEIVVSRGATLSGRVVPPAIVELLDPACQPGNLSALRPGMLPPLLRLYGRNGRMEPPGGKIGFPIAADGSFRIEGIPPGEWEVTLFWWALVFGNFKGSASSTGQEGHPPLARISLLDGETRELELDARAFLPGSLRGRILLEGRPLPRAIWTLLTAAGNDRNRIQILGPPTDELGSFHAPRVPPGPCWLRVEAAPGGPAGALYAVERATVLPGLEAMMDFHLASAALRIRILALDGETPLPGRTLHLKSAALLSEEVLQTDEQGRVLLAPAPPGEIEVYLRSPETPEAEWQALPWEEKKARLLPLGTIRAEHGKPETEAVLRIPPSAR